MAKKTKYTKTHASGMIPLGPKPADKRDAWRALTPEAKEALTKMRARGEFGGTPSKVPYWVSQEYGEPGAHVEARHYIANSLDALWGQLPGLVDDWLRS